MAVSDVVVENLVSGKIQPGPVDIVLGCGDLPPEYLGRLGHRFKAPVFYVRGNHDLRYPHRSLSGCINLHARVMDHGGLTLAGLEGSRWYNGGPAQYRDIEMKRIIRRRIKPGIKRAGKIDILVSHAPPRHVHDRNDRCHKGFKCFHKVIEQHNPRFWLHGHIHAGFKDPHQRITLCGQTQVINCYGYFFFTIPPAGLDK